MNLYLHNCDKLSHKFTIAEYAFIIVSSMFITIFNIHITTTKLYIKCHMLKYVLVTRKI